jgi:hypothetical protein
LSERKNSKQKFQIFLHLQNEATLSKDKGKKTMYTSFFPLFWEEKELFNKYFFLKKPENDHNLNTENKSIQFQSLKEKEFAIAHTNKNQAEKKLCFWA